MKVENVIYINSSPEIVWSVTENVERWPEWTPTVDSVTLMGDKKIGLGSVAQIKQPMQPEAEWLITKFEKGRFFTWETRRTGLHMTGTHKINWDASGTKNVLEVEVRGFLGILLWPLLFFPINRALADENLGLKKRCEEIAQTDFPKKPNSSNIFLT